MRTDTAPEADAPTVMGRGYSVKDLAWRWRVGEDKVRGLLGRGELVGVNMATNLTGRPQWRIAPEAVAAFEARRTSAPPPPKPARRRAGQGVDFFPD